MDSLSEFKKILGQHFTWNKARLDCFTRILTALIAVRTVNLKEIATAFSSKKAKLASRYQRIKRFFSAFQLNYDLIAQFVFSLFFSGKKVYLTLDRTNWFWGKAKINIFMLGVAYEGIAIPLLWKLLPKAGNASAAQHIAMIKRFTRLFGKKGIVGILADREFGSSKLFQFLNQRRIPFYIRIKEDSRVCTPKKKLSTPKKIFSRLNNREKAEFHMTVWIFGQKVYLAGSRSERGELLIVATNQLPHHAVEIYLRRWEIEMLFSSLKTRGFRLEETHLTQRDRLEKLVGVLAIAFSWVHRVGEWRAEKNPIPFSKHHRCIRPQNSFFRYGLDWVREIILDLSNRKKDFKEIIEFFRLLSPPDLYLPSATRSIL